MVTCKNYFDVGSAHQSLMLHTSTGCNNNYGKKTMKVSGPSVWNAVPEYIQKLTSIHSFKSKFKAYLIEQYNTNNDNDNISINRTQTITTYTSINTNRNTNTNHRHHNNNYGLLSSRPAGAFQSRWSDGPNNLI